MPLLSWDWGDLDPDDFDPDCDSEEAVAIREVLRRVVARFSPASGEDDS